MKKLLLFLILLSGLTACQRHEDDPPAGVAHVGGQWAGNGTQQTIGYYNMSATLRQSGMTAAGEYTTVSSYATTTGTIYVQLSPSRGASPMTVTLTQTSQTVSGTQTPCSNTFHTNTQDFTNGGLMVFSYAGAACTGVADTGGLNMRKIAGTN